MAIHSSTIAWKTPWTEEPGRLQSMGSQRVGNNWATSFTHSLRLVIAFLPRRKSFNFVAEVTVCRDFGTQQYKICHCFHCFCIYLPLSVGTICHDLLFFECCVWSQRFHSPLSPSSKGSLVSLCFLLLDWYHIYIWGSWYFSKQSWLQLVLYPIWHLTWCTLHKLK